MTIQSIKWSLFHMYLEWRVFFIRKKKRIRFGFLVQELTQWKTELLYQAMLKHPRFEPILCISQCLGYPGAEKALLAYCDSKGYEYVLLDPHKTICEQVRVDMVVHQKPYTNEIHIAHNIDHNKNIPCVVIPYYLSTITVDWGVNQRVNLLCWRQFVDNDSCRDAWARVHRFRGMNYVVTGLPIMDELLTPKHYLSDVWPNNDGRKRIIYAPHHTIGRLHKEGIGYSTFLDYYQTMLDLRDRYKDDVYFVFKPHPSLRNSLYKYWGRDRTEAYYNIWNEPGVSHVEEGKYLALFKYSDAMIHDCSSFTIEYMYMDNPVMYLERDNLHTSNMIPYAKEAYNLHYKGKCVTDIEQFIDSVIKDYDPLKESRRQFKQRYLLPPNGNTACENIINSILG